MASKSRILLAFVCAGLTTLLGVMLSHAAHMYAKGDHDYVFALVVIPLFGFPFILGSVLVAGLVYSVAKSANLISKRLTIGTGAILGALIGLFGKFPLMPVWSATLIGAAAGTVWWRVARLDQSQPPAA